MNEQKRLGLVWVVTAGSRDDMDLESIFLTRDGAEALRTKLLALTMGDIFMNGSTAPHYSESQVRVFGVPLYGPADTPVLPQFLPGGADAP